MDDSFKTWFDDRVKSIVSKYHDQKVILLFLGLSNVEAKLLASSPYGSASLRDVLESDGTLSLTTLAESRKKMIWSLPAAEGPITLLYEQGILVKNIIADSDVYDGKVIVVKNNLFLDSEDYPSPVSTRHLSELSSFLDQLPNSEEPLAAKYYAQVSSVGDHFLAKPIRIDDEVQCEEVNLVEVVDSIDSGEVLS